jgi:probable rRNA maturation factor
MSESPLSQTDIEELSLPGLHLELYAAASVEADVRSLTEPFRQVWPPFLALAKEEKLFDRLGIDIEMTVLNVELCWADNAMIRELNREYRQKDAATDVLSFPLLAEGMERRVWQYGSQIPLGNLFISVEWARDAVSSEPEQLRYLMERFIHGMLHLLGQHHDTMGEYLRVVEIQKTVLDQALGGLSA